MLKLAISVIFLFAFFGNTLVEMRLMSPYASITTEAFVYLIFLYSLLASRLRAERYSLQLWFAFGLFLIATFNSMTLNNYFNFAPILSLRIIFRFYLFYLAIINIGLDNDMLRSTNKLLFILFIIQLPVVAYKFAYRGITEDTIGTYATHGGGLTPIIPIVALGYLAGYFFFYERRYYFVLLAIGFVLLGIAGEKRVLLFVYPISFMGIYFIACVAGRKVNIIKQFGIIICIVVVSIAVSTVILKYHRGYVPYNSPKGGGIDVGKALDYAEKYTMTMEKDKTGVEKAGGRVAMTLLALEIAFRYRNIFLGFGPGSLTSSMLGSRFDKRLIPIYLSYGKTGFVHIFIEYGLLGVIGLFSIFYVFASRCWKWFKYETDPYWKAFAMGSLIFTIHCTFIFFCYNTTPLLGDTITPVYYYAMAVMQVKFNEMNEKQENEILKSR